MREFNDADRKKKRGRIQLPENPGNLSEEALAELEKAVRAAVKDGCVPCPSAWRVAKDLGVSRLDVGVMVDRLGIRVSDCQLGAFKVGKTSSIGEEAEPFDDEVARRVEDLHLGEGLTCSALFALASELAIRPKTVVAAANARRYKFRQCQLGCF
ncbi:MAG: hypothetical protein HY900_29945 [Deltaproteobacteria bacterium]|nr:hypothetical protein [Deltaproteobacteria bacterium]